jgi:hypothetical protein
MESSNSRTHRSEQLAAVDTTPIREASTPPATSDLSIRVPNERDGPSRVAFVEAVLVELAHEAVALVYERPRASESERIELECVDDVGQRFVLRQYVPRHGWTDERVPRSEARSKLLSLASHSPNAGVDKPASMRVQPMHELQTGCTRVDR